MRTHISKVFVKSLHITVHDFQGNQLVVSVCDLADEEQRCIAPVYNLYVVSHASEAKVWSSTFRPWVRPYFLSAYFVARQLGLPLNSITLLILGRRDRTSCDTSRTAFALTLFGKVIYHLLSRSFPGRTHEDSKFRPFLHSTSPTHPGARVAEDS